MINVNSIHYHLPCDTRLLKNESLFGRIQLHKHTDVGIICFCVEVNVLDVWRLFLNLLNSAKTEIKMNVTSIPISIH